MAQFDAPLFELFASKASNHSRHPAFRVARLLGRESQNVDGLGVMGEDIQVQTGHFPEGVAAQPSAVERRVVAEVVIDQAQLRIIELTAPLEGILQRTRRGDGPVGE